ncbi:MAG: hypothetical protein IJI34_04215 [Clostridia bacterium]|nr:hypothetical protein [Clostridia bacterium]
MKKTIAWILCILMMLALIPAAFADGNVLPPTEANTPRPIATTPRPAPPTSTCSGRKAVPS